MKTPRGWNKIEAGLEAQTEAPAEYRAGPTSWYDQDEDDKVIARALEILRARLRTPGAALSSSAAVRDYLRLTLASRPHEVFVVLMLDAQNRLIIAEELFRGTLTQTSVYPREVVKQALAHNAAAVIFAHNHPSGAAEPSRADEMLTLALKNALALVEIRVHDHLIVAGNDVVSLAERGML